MMAEETNGVRDQIAKLLSEGLKTKTELIPETEKEFGEILKELRELNSGDLQGKLVIAGFINHPYGEEQFRCMECVYYLVHRKWWFA